jgi:hypothetical protein
MFTHRLVVDAFYRLVVSVVVLLVGGFMIGLMAFRSVVWWILGAVISIYLVEDCVLKFTYFRRQLNYTARGRAYPHFLLQLAELYPAYVHVPEQTDVPADDDE